MFHFCGYKNWIEQSACYRKALYELFSIKSTVCNHCTNCIHKNTINQTAIQATTQLNMEEKKRQIVIEALQDMLTTCLVCSRVTCNGIQCFPEKRSRCFCCHVRIVKSTFHKSSNCPADTTNRKIDTKGQSCPSCFMSISELIPDRGTSDDHMNNNCRHKKRIKRVLLYGVENAPDPGVSARSLLVSVLSNPTHWFSVMASNIETIRKQKRNC